MQDSFDSRVVKKATFAMFQHSIVFCLQNTVHVFLPVLPVPQDYRATVTFFSSFPWGTYFTFHSLLTRNSRRSYFTWQTLLSLKSWTKKQIKQSNGYSLFLCHLKLRSKIFPKRSHKNCSNFALIDAAKRDIRSLSNF